MSKNGSIHVITGMFCFFYSLFNIVCFGLSKGSIIFYIVCLGSKEKSLGTTDVDVMPMPSEWSVHVDDPHIDIAHMSTRKKCSIIS